jgi:CHAD domain-containing protein
MVRKRRKQSPIPSDESVVRFAGHAVHFRLGTVSHFLPLAARHADDDVEYVHQLRVGTRRALACLAIYQSVLPMREVKWFRKQLRRIRKAAGEARDLDVFLIRYADCKKRKDRRIVRQLRRRREAAQQPIVELHQKLMVKPRYEMHRRRLLQAIDDRRFKPDVAIRPWAQDQLPWAQDQLGVTAGRFFDSIPDNLQDPEQLHRFRIKTKELRYAIEILTEVLPNEASETILPLVKQLQEHLGEINDRAVARTRLQRWAKRTGGRRKPKRMRKMAARESKLLKRSIKDFGRWWTPAFAERLRTSIEDLSRPPRVVSFSAASAPQPERYDRGSGA